MRISRRDLATTARGVAALAGVIVFAVWVPASRAFVLVEDGTPAATVVVDVGDDFHSEWLPLGVRDFIDHIERISGAKLNVVENPPLDGPAVRVQQIPQTDELTADGFALSIEDDGITLAAWGDEGLHNGLIELLDRLGVRWYWPGPSGELVPAQSTVRFVNAPRQIINPDYFSRRGISGGVSGNAAWNQTVGDWSRRNRSGGWISHGSGHSYHLLVPASRYFEEHPEYFALIGGKRDPRTICVSNPDVADAAAATAIEWLRREYRPVVFVSPPDGLVKCVCENCQKLDYGSKWRSDRVAYFANEVARRVGKEYPQARIAVYNYVDYQAAPTHVKPDGNVMSYFALWPASTGVHWSWPASDDQHNGLVRSQFLANAEAYQPIGIRAYYGHYNWFSYWPQVHLMVKDLPWWHEHGARCILSESHQHWATQSQNFFWMYRLAWDVDTDVSAEMDRYYDDFLGPAGPSMRRLDDLIVQAFSSNGRINGLPFEDAQVYTPQFLGEANGLMADAVSACSAAGVDPIYGQRLAQLQSGLRITRLWTDGVRAIQAYGAARRADDRAAAIEHLSRLDAVISDPNHPGLVECKPEKGINIAERVQELLGYLQKSGTRFLKPGKISYRDLLNGGGRANFDALTIDGFVAGEYGFELPAHRKGRMEWEFVAETGSFGETTLAIDDPVDQNPGSFDVSISIDGGETYQRLPFERSEEFTVKYRARQLTITQYVLGRQSFRVRIDAENKTGANKLVVDTFILESEVRMN